MTTFDGFAHAYVNPGHRGEGSAVQEDALREMAELAQNPKEWADLFLYAHGLPFEPSFWRLAVAKDKEIAAQCLEKIKSFQDKWDWQGLRDELSKEYGKEFWGPYKNWDLIPLIETLEQKLP
jgi:hypothetical protein